MANETQTTQNNDFWSNFLGVAKNALSATVGGFVEKVKVAKNLISSLIKKEPAKTTEKVTTELGETSATAKTETKPETDTKMGTNLISKEEAVRYNDLYNDTQLLAQAANSKSTVMMIDYLCDASSKYAALDNIADEQELVKQRESINAELTAKYNTPEFKAAMNDPTTRNFFLEVCEGAAGMSASDRNNFFTKLKVDMNSAKDYNETYVAWMNASAANKSQYVNKLQETAKVAFTNANIVDDIVTQGINSAKKGVTLGQNEIATLANVCNTDIMNSLHLEFLDADASRKLYIESAANTPSESLHINDKYANSLTLDIELARMWANPNVGLVVDYLADSSSKLESVNRIPDSKAQTSQFNLCKTALLEKYGNDEKFVKAFEDPAVQQLIGNFSNIDAMDVADRKELWNGIKAYKDAAVGYVSAYETSDNTKMKEFSKAYDAGLDRASVIVDKYEDGKLQQNSEGKSVTEIDLLSDIADKNGSVNMKIWVNDYIKYNSKSDYTTSKSTGTITYVPRSESYVEELHGASSDDRQYE